MQIVLPKFLPIFQGKFLAVQAGCVSLGAFMQRLSLWGIIVLLAQLGSEEVVGQLALATAIVLPLTRFSAMQLPQVVLSRGAKPGDVAVFQTAHLLSSGFVFVGLMVGCRVVNADPAFTKILLILAAARSFEGFSELSYAFLQREGRFQIVAILQTIRSIVSFGVAAAAFVITKDLSVLAMCLAIVWGGAALLFDVPLAFRHASIGTYFDSNIRIDRKTIAQLLVTSFPLGICSLITISFASMPRYILNFGDGLAAVGVFEAIAALTLVVDLLSQSLARAIAPRFASAFELQDLTHMKAIYRRVTTFYVVLGLLGIAGGILLGPVVLRWVYSSDYAKYANILVVLLGARAFAAASSCDSLLVTLGRRINLTVIWSVSAMALVGLLLLPIAEDGLLSVSFAVLGASAVRCLLVHLTILSCLRSQPEVLGKEQQVQPAFPSNMAA